MKIKKIGHCCLLVNSGDLTILTDPGSFTVEQNSIKGIDVVLITHEHGDHLHVDSVKEILMNNPDAVVVTNAGVGKMLDKSGIKHTVLDGQSMATIKGVEFEASDGKHEEIFEEMGQVQNTGYLVGGKLFIPGDSFHDPKKSVEILALPIAGPWCKIPDALRFAIKLKPKKAFPVHDGMIIKSFLGNSHIMIKGILAGSSVEFIPMADGDEKDL